MGQITGRQVAARGLWATARTLQRAKFLRQNTRLATLGHAR